MKDLNMIDPASPYFLNPSDHPGYAISLVILNGDNYENWSWFCINSLKAKNRFGFVNEKITKPVANTPEADASNKPNCNSFLTGKTLTRKEVLLWWVAWLCNVIDKTLHGSLAYANTGHAIWAKLEEHFSQAHSIRGHELKR